MGDFQVPAYNFPARMLVPSGLRVVSSHLLARRLPITLKPADPSYIFLNTNVEHISGAIITYTAGQIMQLTYVYALKIKDHLEDVVVLKAKTQLTTRNSIEFPSLKTNSKSPRK